MLIDLTGMMILPQDVAPIVARGTGQLSTFVTERYAMVVPATLTRMQVWR